MGKQSHDLTISAADGSRRPHRRRLAAIDAATLARPVLDFRNNALGTGLSHYVTLHGVIHHAIYHAGQIALLKRALG